MGVPEELKAKRSELAGRARDLTAALAELQAQIAAVDKVISIYEPEWKSEEQPKRRRGRPRKNSTGSSVGRTSARWPWTSCAPPSGRCRPPNARRNSRQGMAFPVTTPGSLSSRTACLRSSMPFRRPDASATLACWTAIAASGRSLPQSQAGAKGLSKSSKSRSGGLFPWQ